MTYCIETYGCQMNKAESQALERLFDSRAWTKSDDPLVSDLVLVNTCSVRITAETRVFGRLGLLSSEKRKRLKSGARPLMLVVTGCMAERLKLSMKTDFPEVDYVVGTFQKAAFGLLLDAMEQGKTLDALEETPAYAFAKSHYEPGSFQSFVPVMHGCDNFCSYCIVPYLRGSEVSRDPAEIVSEILELEDSGVREITLLGQNVNSYKYELADGMPLDFTGMLSRLTGALNARGRRGIRWIRFLTSHPKDLSDALISFMRDEPLMARHIHLCVQHGSDDVLERMNRKYTSESYLALVDRIRSAMPGISISTDILIGFPGETQDDFRRTLGLMEKVRFSHAFMYHFNPREGTPAFSFDSQVPEETRLKRLNEVIQLQLSITRAEMEKRLGSETLILAESISKKRKGELLGRTEREEMVVFEGEPLGIGKFARVRLRELSGNTFKADFVKWD